MDQKQIDEGLEVAKAQFENTGDRAGYAAAQTYWTKQQAELDATQVKAEEGAQPRISDAAMEVIEENLLPLDLFEDYSVVSVSVARRVAEQYMAVEEPAEEPEPVQEDSWLEVDEEEILGELPDDMDEDDDEIEDTAAF